VLSEPLCYIDHSDEFVNTILEERKRGPFSEQLTKKVYRYFKYLSYLPLIVNNTSSTLVFLATIDLLESDIAESLNCAVPPIIFERMKPNSKLYLTFFEKFGLEYIEQ
jgi:hypothetical protein